MGWGCASGAPSAGPARGRTTDTSWRHTIPGPGLTGSTSRRIACLAALALAPAPASAQAVLEQFSYDALRPTGLQVDAGVLISGDLENTLVAGVRLDGGRLAPRFRVLVGLSYFRSDFDASATARFEQRLRDIV